MDNPDALNFLTGSAVRWHLLVALAEEPRDFGALREDLDVPQSTLNRNLTKLAEEGWVRERTDRTYRLTALGEFFVEQFTPMTDVMTVVDRLSEYPDSFPVDEWDFDVSRLADAEYIYGLAVVDDEKVLLTGDHEGGMPGVLFETTDPEIVSWTIDEFERIYDRSTLATEYAE